VSHYGVVFPEYWSGPTGRAIQQAGKDPSLLGLYLVSNRMANMIGLYRLPLATILDETPLGRPAVGKAFEILAAEGFAEYDAVTEYVWVHEMAKFRLGLLNRAALDADDKRTRGAQKLYEGLDDNPFLGPFFEKYRRTLHLKRLRSSTRYPNPSPLRSPLQAPSKPVKRSVRTGISDQRAVQSRGQDQGAGTEIRIRKSTAASRRPTRSNGQIQNQTGTVIHGLNPTATGSDVSTTLRDCSGADYGGSDDRRGGMEGSDPRPVGRIGFHVPGPAGSDGSSHGGGRVCAREGGNTATAALVTPNASASDTATSKAPPDAPGGDGTEAPADGRVSPEALASHDRGEGDEHARADQSLDGADGAADTCLSQDGEGLGESAGQGELRRTIERLRRELGAIERGEPTS
jgi:hypothetical protein